MNAKASQTEKALGRRIMTRCHAFWSFGAVTGALIGGLFAEGGIGFLTQQLVLQPVFAGLSFAFATRLLADEPSAEAPSSQRYILPSGPLLALCLVPLGALFVEGAMMEWSALLLREHVGAGPLATAATFSTFALVMALGRLVGDPLAERFEPEPVIRASAVLMGVGIAGFGLSTDLRLSVPFAALAGAGCANIYPLTMSIIARMPGQRTERNVATLALVAFTAFLISPPAIGVLATLFGLPVALALLAPLGAAPRLLLRRAAGQPQ